MYKICHRNLKGYPCEYLKTNIRNSFTRFSSTEYLLFFFNFTEKCSDKTIFIKQKQ